MKNPHRLPMQKPVAGSITLPFSLMETRGNSCWQEASIFLYKKESLWTQSQRERADILFKEYPEIKKGYYLAMRLGLIYHQCKFKDVALTRLARWYDEVDKSGFLAFGRVARSIQTHYLNIINFFEKRATNAAAESFNAKLKAFRAQFRGVKDKAFFLYRLTMLYA